VTSGSATAKPGSSAWHIQLFSTAVSAPIRWRLLSGNNRDMGRSTEQYADAHACELAIKELQSNADELVAKVRRVDPSQWIFQIWWRDLPIAAAGHRFDRLIRCEQGMEQFLENFATAPVGATVMLSDSRRWRTAS
jgi:uncharacterized protein YegP (UPF0339 family)